MAKHNPDTEDIWTHYPQRPDSLENICTLWLTVIGKADMMMETEGTPNSKIHVFQTTSCSILERRIREDYFYSLILLFVPFRCESSLLLQNE